MIVVLMGVSGVGKTTVGELLAQATGWQFYDADNFHSPANVEKMRNGTPLNDEDRWPWLDRLNALLREAQAAGSSAILACSALKQRYRERLARDCPQIEWIFLKGDFELIQSRLSARTGHYMNANLLQSQFAALEEPPGALAVDVQEHPERLVAQIRQAITRQGVA